MCIRDRLYVIGQWIIISCSVCVYATVIGLYCVLTHPRFFRQRAITYQQVYSEEEEEQENEWNVL